jgi:hypothetical protein
MQQRMAGAVEFLAFEDGEHAAIRLLDEAANHVASGPDIARGAPRGVGFAWIDAAREQLLELRIDARAAEPLFTSVLKLNAGRCPS